MGRQLPPLGQPLTVGLSRGSWGVRLALPIPGQRGTGRFLHRPVLVPSCLIASPTASVRVTLPPLPPPPLCEVSNLCGPLEMQRHHDSIQVLGTAL